MTDQASDPAWELDHPYSSALLIEGVAYLSGCTPIADGKLVTGRREAFDATLAVLKGRLAVVGLGLEHVVKITYFLTDISLRDECNEQFMLHFARPRPVRSVLVAAGLPYGANVEIDAIAHVKGRA